jgi:hypothetical protein
LILVAATWTLGARPAAAQMECDPSYPDVCIPPPPPNLNCPDIPYYRDFTVAGDDPHGFDGDHNGIACEAGQYGTVAPQPTSAGTATPTATSPAVAAATATPQATAIAGAPVAGFGPDDWQGAAYITVGIAALAGAGIAWLLAGALYPRRPRG